MLFQCDATTKSKDRCSNRGKFVVDNQHFCGIHSKRFTTESLKTSTIACSVCFDDSVPEKRAIRTACGHVFCKKCLNRWLRKNHTCPLCRFELREPDDIDLPTDEDLEIMANHFITELVRRNQITLLDDNHLYVTIELDENNAQLLEHWNNHVHHVDQLVYLL